MTENLQPSTDDVLQAIPEEPLSAVPVILRDVQTPVRVQVLPRRSCAAQTRPLTAVARRLATADPYRAIARIVADEDIHVAATQHGAGAASTSAWWPADVPLEITATTEIWARLATAQSGTVSMISERWATSGDHADD